MGLYPRSRTPRSRLTDAVFFKLLLLALVALPVFATASPAAGQEPQPQWNPPIEAGGDNSEDQIPRTPLVQAILKKDVAGVRSLLAQGADPNEPSGTGVSPMGEAVTANSPEIESALIDAIAARPGAANTPDKFGITPIIYAAATPCIDKSMIDKLLQAGALTSSAINWYDPSLLGDGLNEFHRVSLNAPAYMGYNALHVAAATGNVNAVKALLAEGMAVDGKTVDGYTPLQLAAQSANEATLVLLAAHADPNALDPYGDTALHIALSPPPVNYYGDSPKRMTIPEALPLGSTAALSALIKVSDLKRKNHLGLTPTLIAVMQTNADILPCFAGHTDGLGPVDTAFYAAAVNDTAGLTKLLEATPSLVGIRLPNTWTILDIACLHGAVDAVKTLIARGADVNLPNAAGDTPLTIALESPYVKDQTLVDYLLDHGANGNVDCADGDTPLIKAIKSQNEPLAEELLAHGVNVNNCDAEDVSPFRMALSWSRPLAEKILAAGANVNVIDSQGATALSDAVSSGDLDLVKELIAKGAGVNRAWPDGPCPIETAVNDDNADMVSLLLDHGATLDVEIRPGFTLRMLSMNRHPALQPIIAAYEAKHPAPKGPDNNRQPVLPDYNAGVMPLGVLMEHGKWDDAAKQIMLFPDVAGGSLSSGDAEETELFEAVRVADSAAMTVVIKPMVAAGVDPNALCENDRSALMEDLRDMNETNSAYRVAIAAALIANGANPKENILGRHEEWWYPYCPSGRNLLFIAPTGPAVALLAAHGADPNQADANGDTPLFVAGNDDAQDALLAAGADPNHVDYSGYTPLTSLLHDRRSGPISETLIARSNLSIADPYGVTPIRRVLSQGRGVTWKRFQDANPKLDADSAFLAAVAKDDLATVAKALAANPALAFSRGGDGSTALAIAATWGSLNVARTLLDAGADVNGRDVGGLTPLIRAATPVQLESGPVVKDEMCHLLIEHGADIDAVDTDGESALSIAVANSEEPVVKLLTDHKANANWRSPEGATLLVRDYDENFGNSPKIGAIVKELIDDGMDINAGGTKWASVVVPGSMEATRGNQPVGVRLKGGETPLDEAVSRGNGDWYLTVLLGAGANLEARDYQGRTAIFYALRNFMILRKLIAAGANVNAADNYGVRPLDLAMTKDYQFSGAADDLRKAGAIAGAGIDPHQN